MNSCIEVPFIRNQCVYNIEDIIGFDGKVIHLSSLLFRTKAFSNENVPPFFYNAVVGDLPLMLILSTKGEFYYINKVMSCTRRGVPNGASERLFKQKEMYIRTNNRIIEIYNDFNVFTEYKYAKCVGKVVEKRIVLTLKHEGNFEEIQKTKYYKNQNMFNKIKLFLYCKYPFIYIKVGKIKNVFIKKISHIRGCIE
jgi:hypothetical protein